MRNYLERMMAGRYGSDSLNRFLNIIVLVFLVVSMILHRPLFYYLGVILLVYTLFRMLSRNIYARRAENDKYEHLVQRVRKLFRVEKKRIREHKYYRYFRCPSCGQHMRVPKGRGHVVVTCPKCRHSFDKTT